MNSALDALEADCFFFAMHDVGLQKLRKPDGPVFAENQQQRVPEGAAAALVERARRGDDVEVAGVDEVRLSIEVRR